MPPSSPSVACWRTAIGRTFSSFGTSAFLSHFSSFLTYSCFILGVLSKETAVVMLGLAVLHSAFRNGHSIMQVVRQVISALPFVFGIFVAYLAFRVSMMSESYDLADSSLKSSGLIRVTENPLHFLHGTLSFPFPFIPPLSIIGMTWLRSLLYIQAYCAYLLVFPLQLCAEYSFNWFVYLCVCPFSRQHSSSRNIH